MLRLDRRSAVAAALLLFPAIASAQTGADRDDWRRGPGRDRQRSAGRDGRSGQPRLDREGPRSVVTDEQGNYKIVDLRPGVYYGDLHAARASARSGARASS